MHCETAPRPAVRMGADQCTQHRTADCAAAAVADESSASECCSSSDWARGGTRAASRGASFPIVAAEKNGDAAAMADDHACAAQ